MAELVAELIGELRPGPLADVDDDPGHAAAVGVQPDGRRPGCMLVDAQARRLAVGEKADAIEACVPHAFDNLIGRAGHHVAPIAGELDGRGEQRRGLLDRWGKLCHDCHRSSHRPNGAHCSEH